jgi:hypothetical protein
MAQYDNLVRGFEVGALLATHAKDLGTREIYCRLKMLRSQVIVDGEDQKRCCYRAFAFACDSYDLEPPHIWNPSEPMLDPDQRKELRDKIVTCRKAIHEAAEAENSPEVGNLIDWVVHYIYLWDGIDYFG